MTMNHKLSNPVALKLKGFRTLCKWRWQKVKSQQSSTIHKSDSSKSVCLQTLLKTAAQCKHSQHPYLDHSNDMARVQQINHSLGRKFEADLHSKSQAQGNQQQVLAQTILFCPWGIFSNHTEVSWCADLLQRHPDLHQGDQDDDQGFNGALLRSEEASTFGAPVAFKLRVYTAVDPVQQAVDVVSRHIHLLALEKIWTRWNKRRDSDFLAKHELQDFSSVTDVPVEEWTCIHRLGVLLLAKLLNHLIYSRMGNSG